MEDIVIASAARTPVGNFSGALSALSAHEIAIIALKAAFERAGVAPAEVDELILGQILATGEGQNPARQAARGAGMPDEKTAFGINQLCGSGLRSVALAAQQIRTGESKIVAAGGMESMTNAQHAAYLRNGVKMGQMDFLDTLLRDGLFDVFNGYHMGVTAENVAQKFQITRDQQDELAFASQQKASAAQKAGKFKDEIVPVTIKTRKGDVVVSDDEFIRHDATLEGLKKLRPAFNKEGTVTAGNASGINDGAAALIVMSADEAQKRGVKPIARIASFATAGVDPAIMGTGPIPACARRSSAQAGRSATSISSKPTRRSPRRRARSTRSSAGIRRRSTSTAAQSRSVTRSALQAHAFSPHSCTRCRSVT